MDKQKILALCEDFKLADLIIQEVKDATNQEATPAISQLRYAGWHFALWVQSVEEGSPNDKEFEEALSHSKRAVFDASRFGALFCAIAIKKFRDEYGGDILPSTITDYSEKMRRVEQASQFLKVDGDKDTRAKACHDHFIDLQRVLQELIACQPELNELRRKENDRIRKEERNHKLTLTGIAISVVGIIIAIVALG
jgi:hypothetical protein